MRALIPILVLLLALPAATAITDYDGNTSGPHIMGDESSASSSTGVGPDGVSYRADVQQLNTSCTTGEMNNVTGYETGATSTGEYTISFTGILSTANPCYTIDHEVSESGPNTYVMNVKGELSEGTCIQCVGALTYSASFSADRPYALEIRHDNTTVQTITTPNYPAPAPNEGIITRFLNWLRSLF